jgi:hypothetical protein
MAQNGIFEMLSSPVAQGLLAGGLGALASRGSTAQAIGRGGLLGMSAFGQAQGAQQNRLLEEAKKQAQQQALSQLKPGADGQINATPSVLMAAGFNDPSKWEAIRNLGRDKVKEFQDVRNSDGTMQRVGFTDYGGTIDTGRATAKELTNVNGVATDMWNSKDGQVLAQDPNAPFYLGSNGQMLAHGAYQDYAKQKAASGATRVSTIVNNKMGESLAGQIGPMMKESQTAAEAAVKQLQAADTIDRALDSGNVITGAGAGVRMTATQIADALGMTGADQKEKLSRTRETIQGLAQLTLQGRQQMRGQGAITDSESKLAERAISGDVSLTTEELRVLTNAARRSGQHVFQEHQRKARVIQNNPDYSAMAPFYDVPQMQQPQQQPQAPAAGGGWGIQKVN